MAINVNNNGKLSLSTADYGICDQVWPPGFRFHPTDEELILYYLKRKIFRRRLKLDVIYEVDVYKCEPEELPGLSLLKNRDRQWFFFSPRDRKYPHGSRSNITTRNGYWKTTGKDRTITCNSRNVGLKKTLVFYRGRAPSGARTDWVMHEYTLDEDELKRCQSAQDYYAIYKLFKKSGPGPKNGEQYGALFREEDWVDDDCPAIICSTDQTDHVVQANNVVVDNCCKDTKVDHLFDDIEKIVNHLIPEPIPQPPDVDDFEKALSQFVGEEEFHNTLVNTSFDEPTYAEPCATYAVNSQQNDFVTSIDVTHATTSVLQTWGVSKVTSNNANSFNPPPIAAEEDFLEMNDLLGLGPSNEHDIFYDANIRLLPDTHVDPQEGGWNPQVGFQQHLLSDSHKKSQESGWDPQGGFQHQHLLSDSHTKTQESRWGPQVGFQRQHYPESASLFHNEMWCYDPTACLSTTMATNPGSVPLPPTGFAVTSNIGTESIQEQQRGKYQHMEGGVQPQPQAQTQTQNQALLSSSLWSFVESIPAAPASAAESDMMNKTFERMPSFSRVKVGTKSTILTACSTTSTCTSTCSGGIGGRIKCFFFFSFLVALFAVVCVFFGSKSSGKLHSRMCL